MRRWTSRVWGVTSMCFRATNLTAPRVSGCSTAVQIVAGSPCDRGRGGGEMIDAVSIRTTERPMPVLPHKFEAGTPHISGAIGLGVALNLAQRFGRGVGDGSRNGIWPRRLAHGLRKYRGHAFHRDRPGISRSGEFCGGWQSTRMTSARCLIRREWLSEQDTTAPSHSWSASPYRVRCALRLERTTRLQEVDTFVAATERAVNMLRA